MTPQSPQSSPYLNALLTEEVGSVHMYTKNISREPIGYNTKIDTEGIARVR